jgi:hypothetical protein
MYWPMSQSVFAFHRSGVEAIIMQHHRFREQFVPPSVPRVASQPLNSTAFCVCPTNPFGTWPWQQLVYQIAFREAQAVVRPSLLERDLLGVWN